jgi:hypothetical protein
MRSLTFLFLVISTAVFAQPTSYGNFKVWEQEIIYQRIVPLDSITPEKLAEYYTAQPFVSNLTSNANGVEFDVNDIVGLRTGAVPTCSAFWTRLSPTNFSTQSPKRKS